MTNQTTRDERDRNRRTTAVAGGSPVSDPASTMLSTTIPAATVDTSPACDTSAPSPSVDCGGFSG